MQETKLKGIIRIRKDGIHVLEDNNDKVTDKKESVNEEEPLRNINLIKSFFSKQELYFIINDYLRNSPHPLDFQIVSPQGKIRAIINVKFFHFKTHTLEHAIDKIIEILYEEFIDNERGRTRFNISIPGKPQKVSVLILQTKKDC